MDLAALQRYIDDDAVFVAMDIEGAPVISELAVSVLPPSAFRRLASGDDQPPSDINDFAEKYGLDTYSFRVNGRHRINYGTGFRRGILQFGEVQWLNENELAEAVTAKFRSIWNHYTRPPADGTPVRRRPLVLTGFHVGIEVHHLTQDLNQVLKAVPFAACVDIQDIIISMSIPTSSRKQTPGLKQLVQMAGLRLRESNTTEEVAAGQFEDIGWSRQCRPGRHAAGNDVVCALGLLAHVVYNASRKARSSYTDTPATMPLIDRLRLMVEGGVHRQKSVRPDPTEEDLMLADNIRKHRLVDRQERNNFLEDLEVNLSSSLGTIIASKTT
ncbi:hypothetical protein SPI_00409 [Niveomyces insectorum RCEF 264]|uniref:QDE-2-interacting protein n=1 Tax=Niveomyces insectorum RCEF 264 TaxID=1081102 RepID=A0A162LBG5_9HYPO|nr:hypothetical protein SPI_00409 [Niveomyces insectorum RCEF 264]